MWRQTCRMRKAMLRHRRRKIRRLLCPRPVTSPLNPYCNMHEWPVALLRDSMRFFAHAAFFVLRALAARVRLVRYGLRTAIRCTLHQGPHSLDSSARQQKNQSPYPPRPTYHEGKPDGGMFRDHDAGFVGTLNPSTISRFCASDIPAEYSP